MRCGTKKFYKAMEEKAESKFLKRENESALFPGEWREMSNHRGRVLINGIYFLSILFEGVLGVI